MTILKSYDHLIPNIANGCSAAHHLLDLIYCIFLNDDKICTELFSLWHQLPLYLGLLSSLCCSNHTSTMFYIWNIKVFLVTSLTTSCAALVLSSDSSSQRPSWFRAFDHRVLQTTYKVLHDFSSSYLLPFCLLTFISLYKYNHALDTYQNDHRTCFCVCVCALKFFGNPAVSFASWIFINFFFVNVFVH